MQVAVVGAGVIGAGWAARFVLHGHNVKMFDLQTNAYAQARAILAQAQAAHESLYGGAPVIGELTFCDSLEDCVENTDWVQECLPERLDLKQSLFVQLAGLVLPNTIVASSTSGYTPSTLLAEQTSLSQQFMVAHPFVPVYLIPLVELVAHPNCLPDHLTKAQTELRAVNMHPLLVKKEIDAHIADRLLEAVWREALWLVKDDVATTADIDEAIKYGFGLRWAQMGLFETYRLGGGEGGMQHFLQQFGPALQLPWSKLTDVPEMDNELINKISEQSDAQAAGKSIGEMTQQRDANLVAILKALRVSQA